MWPKYVWIFHSHRIEDFLYYPSACKIKNAINGIIIIVSQPELYDPRKLGIMSFKHYQQYTSRLSMVADRYNVSVRPNALAIVLHDLVWSMANMINHQGPYIHIWHHDLVFHISHIRNQIQVPIAIVYSNSSTATIVKLNVSTVEMAPTGNFPSVSSEPPIAYTIGMSLSITLMICLVSFMLLLYICFHNESEIKATSFTLSLMMFLGCYFNLLYLCLLTYANHSTINSSGTLHQDAICNLLLWFSAPGISLPFMLATLLVKMLRVYHIFNYVTLHIGHYCSDFALAIYILLILTPSIIIIIVWTSVDKYHFTIEYKSTKTSIEVLKGCDSEYESTWVGSLCIYLFILASALAIVAVKTRKVRMKHFKDTKKVNILLFILCVDIILSFSYWVLLQTLKAKPYIVSIPLNIGHSTLVCSFLSLLFAPKVFPPLWRCMNRRFNISHRCNFLTQATSTRKETVSTTMT